ncbi:MAG: type IV pilin protein [Pseudomonadota bacterium]
MQNGAARGFTLIELMVALAVIAILSAIAYPSYVETVLKGRRTEARAALAELMQQQERHMTQAGSYRKTALGDATAPFKTYAGEQRTSTSYLLGAAECEVESGGALSLNECVRVYATPQQPDAAAGTLWIDSTSRKDCDGTRRTEPGFCWR